MNSKYFPVIIPVKEYFEYEVDTSDESILGTLGNIMWNDTWDCYIFIPDTDCEPYFGPAFLASLVAHMIRLEAKRRKEWMNINKFRTVEKVDE